MIYRIHKPAPPLSQYIDWFFYYRGYQASHQMEKLLPDGSIDLLIDLTDTPKKLFHDEGAASFTTFTKGWISGMKTDYILIDASVSHMIGVHFKPGGLYPFVDFRVSELNNRTLDLDLVFGSSVMDLRDSILEASAIEEKFSRLEAFLLEKMDGHSEKNPFVSYAVSCLLNTPDMWSIGRLTEKTGITQKHLITLFKKHVGLPPKLFARISKFQKVIQLVEQQQMIDWTSLAYECGYYDQAHFIREFRSFSGINPSSYLVQKGKHLNYIPVT